MDELLFIKKLNEKLIKQHRIFKLHKVNLVKRKVLNIWFIVEARDYDKYLNEDLKDKVEAVTREIVPEVFKININYKKTFTEPKIVKQAIIEFVYKEYPLILSVFKRSKIEVNLKGKKLEIIIYVEKNIFQFCKSNELDVLLEKYLDACFMEYPSVKIVEIPNSIKVDIKHKEAEIPKDFGIRLINISIVEHLVGLIGQKPRYIADVKNAEAEIVTLCGTITNLRELTYQRNGVENKFYVFILNDSTGHIEVKFFPRGKKARQAGSLLAEGDKLVMEGPLRYDKFSNGIALFANRLARCEIDFESIDNLPIYKKESSTYTKVYPQKYKLEKQESLFATDADEHIGLFKGKTFVVFDLETTGRTNFAKITEIGAVKIIDGEIKETFSTLVNPETPIPAEVVELTGITDEMVKNAPTFSEVVADFYKFTRKSILVAYNAPFDMGFILRQAEKEKYNFDNKVVDALVLARQNLTLKNYKLKTVCAKFNIEQKDAHRALNDALATAEVFKKLMIIKER